MIRRWILIKLASFAKHLLTKHGITFNTVYVIKPYYDTTNQRWCFDDVITNLKAEGFHEGIGKMIEVLTEKYTEPKAGGWLLNFSDMPFPGYQLTLQAVGYENNGVWYYCHELQTYGWLCEQLYKYYRIAPQYLFIKAEEKPSI